MPDALERVLELVAEGRLTAAEAAPILDALGAANDAIADAEAILSNAPTDAPGTPGSPRAIRIEVTDEGRQVVNLRIPVSLGRMALDRVPGLSSASVESIRRALADGRTGTLLRVDDDGDGVRIAIE
ncbi:MAG TPA: hypothetical protein VH440_05385 [Candidatus Limnocylindrales bacterium]|jgi:hypothetical protein